METNTQQQRQVNGAVQHLSDLLVEGFCYLIMTPVRWHVKKVNEIIVRVAVTNFQSGFKGGYQLGYQQGYYGAGEEGQAPDTDRWKNN